MATIRCANCSAEVNADAAGCPACGADPRTGEGAWQVPAAPEPIRAAEAPQPLTREGSPPKPDAAYPVDLRAEPAPKRSRWWAVASILFPIKLLALLPHLIIMIVFAGVQSLLFLVGQVIVAVKGRWPAELHGFMVGMLRWETRVWAFGLSLTDQYPPFSLDAEPYYPADISVERPAKSSRGYAILNLLVMAATAALGIAFATRHDLGSAWSSITGAASARMIALIPHLFVFYFVGLVAFAVWFAAQWAILFTGALPQNMHGWVTGLLRWGTRISAYFYGLVDDYPRFTFQPSLASRLREDGRDAPPTGVAPAPMDSAVSTYSVPPDAGLPTELHGWNWGAFFFGWVWGVFNHANLGFLIFAIAVVAGLIAGGGNTAAGVAVALFGLGGLALAIVHGVKGNEWAWNKKHFVSAAEFRREQRGWAVAALCMFCVSVVALVGGGILSAVVDDQATTTSNLPPSSVATQPTGRHSAILGHWAVDSFKSSLPGLMVLRGIDPRPDGSFDRGDLEVLKPGQTEGTVIWTPPSGMVVYDFDADGASGRIVATVDEASADSAGYNAHGLVLLDADGTVRRIDGPVSAKSSDSDPVLLADGSVIWTRSELTADSETATTVSAKLMCALPGRPASPVQMNGALLSSLVTPVARPLAGRASVEMEDLNDDLASSVIAIADWSTGVLTVRGDAFTGDIGLGNTAPLSTSDAVIFARQTTAGLTAPVSAAVKGPTRFVVAGGVAARSQLAAAQGVDYIELSWKNGKHHERVILKNGPDMPQSDTEAPFIVPGPPGQALIWGWRTGQAVSSSSVPLLLLDIKTGAIRRTDMVMTDDDLGFAWVQ
jgi:hypothetical protein